MPLPLDLADLPSTVRLFPLPGALLLPHGVLSLNIFEPRYLQMVRDAMATDRLIAMIQPSNHHEPWELYRIGCVGRITQYAETGDGRFLIELTGIARFHLGDEISAGTPYRQAVADFTAYGGDLMAAQPLAAATRADLEHSLRAYLESNDLSADWTAIANADDENLVNTLAAVCPFSPVERQAIAEARTLEDRTMTLVALMRLDDGRGSERSMQ